MSESLVTGDALKQLRVGRVRIDRFTGGAQTTALYDEEPVYGGEVTVTLELRCGLEDEEKTKAMRGLTLLAVKDLITGDLNLGGTGAIGTACGIQKLVGMMEKNQRNM